MPQETRSPWSGLTSAQALTLSDYLSQPSAIATTAPEAFWEAHTTFARRAAMALVGNDLRGALDSAEVSAAALLLWQREGPTDVPGERQPVVDEHPPAALRPEAGPGTRATHGPHRVRIAG